jgi:3-hydroxyisobutyrate dehydrogenase-like beta-hydroxyacid dehydrogenase
VGAQLQALALPKIALPPSTDAVAEAACTAMLEAQRAAEALGLPPVQFDSVCSGLQRATANTNGARRFLAGGYPSLCYTCCAGDEAVARKWMDRMAARAAD